MKMVDEHDSRPICNSDSESSCLSKFFILQSSNGRYYNKICILCIA